MAINASSNNDKIPQVEIKNDPIKVLIESEEVQETEISSVVRRSIIIFVLFLIIAYIYVLSWYVFPTKKSPVQNIASNIGITYTAPRYLAVGDENMIEITFSNIDPNQSIGGVMTLVFTDSTISLMAVPEQRMSFQIEELLPGDRLTRRLKLKLARGSPSNPIEFYFQFTLPDGTQYKSKADTIYISPIPNIRTTWLWITGTSGLIGLFVTFIFGQFNSLFGSKKN